MPKTLLLADDSVVIQKLVGLSFANEDVELITTDNGDDALTRVRTMRPDLVLADVVMPGKNGYEVCQSIKSDASLRHIPVLLLTGTFEAFDENRAREVGSDGHITKPFEAQGLVDRVTDLLSRTPAAPPPPPVAAQAPPPMPAQAPPRAAAPPEAAAPPKPVPVPRPPAAHNDDSYDFFDDEVQELAAPEEAAATSSGDLDEAFEFGSDLDAFASTGPAEPETLDTNFELDEGESPEDLTVAVLADEEPDTHAVPVGTAAPGATKVQLEDTVVAHDFASAPPRVESLDARLAEPTASPPELRGEAMISDDLFDEPARMTPSPPARPANMPPARPANMPPARPANMPPARPASTPPAPPANVPPPVPPAAARPAPPAAPVRPPAPPPVLERPAPPAIPSVPPPAPRADLGVDDTTDPLAGMSPEPDSFELSDPTLDTELDAPVLADAAESTHSGDFDVSISDLGDPLGASGPVSSPRSPAPGRTSTPVAIEPEVMVNDLRMPASARPAGGGPDLSPVLRQQIHDTLEKVAWEAFADLSDSIVRQVLQRVESVVWEIVPQMAESLIQEEIRRMKGDD